MEEWRDVVGYEGWYQISNLCRVKRIKAGLGARVGYILKTPLSRSGYPEVFLSKNGKVKSFFVHTLMLEAFIGPRPPGYECNHKNCDKMDNRVENLEWVTHSENVQHAFIVLNRDLGGGNNGNAKLSEKKVLKIRRLYATGEYTQRELGKMFHCTQGNIYHIVNRLSWKHI